MMPSDAFFDTNILIYFATSNDAKSTVSERVISRGGVVSVQVLNEFVNVLRRKKAPWSDIEDGLDGIRTACVVTPMMIETHERGVAIARKHHLHIYDSMIVAAAQLAGCKILYSEDMHDGLIIDGLKIVNPYKA